MNEIYEWLNSEKNYGQGLILFGRYSLNTNMLRILKAGGESKRNRETLIYELGKIAKTLPVSKTMPAPKAQKQPEKTQEPQLKKKAGRKKPKK